jgi:hypothetical protein
VMEILMVAAAPESKGSPTTIRTTICTMADPLEMTVMIM